MSVQDYQTTPGANTTIGGINIGENCPPENLNDALRQLMADVKIMYNGFTGSTSYAPINAPQFIGQPSVKDRGAILHHRSGSYASGQVHVINAGQAIPAMQNGDILIELI